MTAPLSSIRAIRPLHISINANPASGDREKNAAALNCRPIGYVGLNAYHQLEIA